MPWRTWAINGKFVSKNSSLKNQSILNLLEIGLMSNQNVDFKWPRSIILATSYSYNSGGHGGYEIYLKTSSNSSKLLQTPPDTFQTLPNPVHTCPNPVQMRPNTSKCVKTCPNASKCSKLVQICPNLLLRTFPSKIYFHLKFFFKKLVVIVP